MSEIAGQHEARFASSSFCSKGACVEVGRSSEGVILVRDAKNRSRPALGFTGEEWATFIAGVKAGGFDLA
jgi:hypothetical protein